jgi:hypothetical protein
MDRQGRSIDATARKDGALTHRKIPEDFEINMNNLPTTEGKAHLIFRQCPRCNG